MSGGLCWNCSGSLKASTPYCGKCGAPVADAAASRACVEYLLREVDSWTFLTAGLRATLTKLYRERLARLSDGASVPSALSALSDVAASQPAASPTSAAPAGEGVPSAAESTGQPQASPPCGGAAAEWQPAPPPQRPGGTSSAPTVLPPHKAAALATDDKGWDEFTATLRGGPPQSSEAREALDAAQAFLQAQNIRWFHGLGALLLVVAGIGFLRANWDAIGSIVVTLGLLVLPFAAFWGSYRLRATLTDSSRGLAILGSVTLPAGLLALEIFGFVDVPRPAWQFAVYLLTAGVLGGVAHLLSEAACIYLSAVSTVLAANQLTGMAPGTFGYPLLAFAFVSSTWAARARNDGGLSVHVASVGQLMARLALAATFGNGIDPNVNHLVVGFLASAWFVYGAVLSPEPNAVLTATLSCALSWLLVYLRSVAGQPTAEGLIERVLAPMGGVLAVTAQQMSVRFDRARALPIARLALLIGFVVLGVATLTDKRDPAGVGSPLLLMIAIEMAALSFLYRGWALGGRDAAQTLFTVAALAAPVGISRLMPATMADIISVTWSYLAETLIFLVVAQALARLRGRAAAQFYAQLAVLVGAAATVLVAVVLVFGYIVNGVRGLLVITVAAAVLEPLFRRWMMYSDVFPMDLVLEDVGEAPASGFELATRPAYHFSMARLLAHVATLTAPLAAAAVTHVEGVLPRALAPSAPLAAAVTVALVLLVVAWRARDDEKRDVHWGEAAQLGSLLGAFWPAVLALLFFAWTPGLQFASFTMGVAAVIFACLAGLFGPPSLEHLAYFLAHALLVFNVPRPIALEWYTLPLGLWVLTWTWRRASERETGELVGLLITGAPSLLASFEQGVGPHLGWALAVSLAALSLGLYARRRVVLVCSVALLVGAAYDVSLLRRDYSIVFGAASFLCAIIEPAFRHPRRADDGEAEGCAMPATGNEARACASLAVLLAPLAAACRLSAFVHVSDEYGAGVAALGGALAAAALQGLSMFARDSKERDVHWRSALEGGSLLAAGWTGALAILTLRPGLNPGAFAVVGSAALIALRATRPGGSGFSHFAFAYLYGLYYFNLPHIAAVDLLRVEFIWVPLASWLFFSAYGLYPRASQAPLEALACLTLGGPLLLASMGPQGEAHAVTTGVVGVALFTLGSLGDRAIPAVMGTFFMGAEALYRVHHLLVSMPWQLYATVAGLFLIATGVLIERQRVWLLAYGDKIARQWTYSDGVLSAPPSVKVDGRSPSAD